MGFPRCVIIYSCIDNRHRHNQSRVGLIPSQGTRRRSDKEAFVSSRIWAEKSGDPIEESGLKLTVIFTHISH